jgi:broad-specificity NMP kinase
MVISCGLPGIGKTTISMNVARLINAVILYTDKSEKRYCQGHDIPKQMHIVECLCPENIRNSRLKTEKMILLIKIFLFTIE